MHHSNGPVTFRRLMAALFSALACFSARAGVITGQLTGSSVFTAYTTTNGTGAATTNLLAAHSVTFTTDLSGSNNYGSFSNISADTAISFYTPLQINPLVPPSTPLWSVGAYSFTATSLTTTFVTNFILQISGWGLLKDGTNADTTSATFSANLTSFGFNSFNFSTTNYTPSVAFTGSGSYSTLSWSTNSTNFILQVTSNLTGHPLWSTFTNVPAIAGTNYVISNLIQTNGQRYFRLIH